MHPCNFTLKPLLLIRPNNNYSTLSFHILRCDVSIPFMMSNVLIVVWPVKQVHKLMVQPPLGNCWLQIQESSATQKVPTSPNKVSDTPLGSPMIKGVLPAASSNMNTQDPFPKPVNELQDSAKSKHRTIAAFLSLTWAPRSPSCFRRSKLQLPFMCFGSHHPGPAGSVVQSSICTAHAFSLLASRSFHCWGDAQAPWWPFPVLRRRE